MRKIRAVIFMAILLGFCLSNSIAVKTEVGIVKMKEFNSSQNTISMQVNELRTYYYPTDEEREMAYKVATAEAGINGELGQILVINCAINNMKAQEFNNLIEEFNSKGRYSSVIAGKVYILSKDQKILVTDEMVTEEIKQSVDKAFLKDYSKEMLQEEAFKKGYYAPKYYEQGARFFYNPNAISEERKEERENIKVSFMHGDHIYYSYWG